MADNIRLEVVTPEGKVFGGDVELLNAPATMGGLGILHNHAPLMTSLDVGVIEYVQAGKRKKMAVIGGFLEVKDNHVTVLANAAEMAESIDEARALAALERAKKRLADRQAGVDVARAEASLARATARLAALK